MSDVEFSEKPDPVSADHAPVDAARQMMSWGAIQFLEAPSSRILKYFLVTLFVFSVGAVISACIFETDISVSAPGEVISDVGTREVVSRAGGLVQSFTKKVGDTVRQDEVIATIASDRTSLTDLNQLRDDLEKQIALVQENLEHERSLKAIPSVDLLSGKISNQEVVSSLIDFDRSRLDFNSRVNYLNVDLKREIAPLKLRVAKLEEKLSLVKHSKHQGLLKYQKESFENEADEVRAKITSSQSSAQHLALESLQNLNRNVKAAISRLDLMIDLFQIKAPIEGRIGQVLTGQNSFVAEGKSIAVILPGTSRLTAELRVPTRLLGKVKLGQKVLFKLESFPYQKFGLFEGKVTSVELPKTDDSHQSVYFQVRATIAYPAHERFLASADEVRLDIGMQFQASIITNHQKILRIVLDQLLGEAH